jgi:hypothetical protein
MQKGTLVIPADLSEIADRRAAAFQFVRILRKLKKHPLFACLGGSIVCGRTLNAATGLFKCRVQAGGSTYRRGSRGAVWRKKACEWTDLWRHIFGDCFEGSATRGPAWRVRNAAERFAHAAVG